MNKVRAYFPKSGHFIQFSRKGRVASPPHLPSGCAPVLLFLSRLLAIMWFPGGKGLWRAANIRSTEFSTLLQRQWGTLRICSKHKHSKFTCLNWSISWGCSLLTVKTHRRCAKAVPIEHWRQNALSVTCVQLFFVHL